MEDRDAGQSQGAEVRKIPEEFFAPADAYRASIDNTKQRLLSDRGQSSPWWSSSTEDGRSGSGSGKRRRRSGRSGSAQEHQEWKRKTSARAYSEYLRSTDPRYRSTDDDASSKSTTISVYPASSSETVADGKSRFSDISSEASGAGAEPEQQAVISQGKPGVTVSTSTTEMQATEGTQTCCSNYLLLDRRSCLVKVLAALQRLNTDEALQVARILRRSLEQDRNNRVYEDADIKHLMTRKRSMIDATGPPAARTESEQVVPRSRSRSPVMRDDIPDQDYDEMTRVVSQIDLMVRSKLRITAAPYSLIYETLINYHLEITQDYSPSVAVFNYYLTEQGHPLFEDTSGFFRPTILQVARESLCPRLYAHQPLGEPRQLPDRQRLLDLQLLLDELLICPFCGEDVVWGQDSMCAEFCCEPFADMVAAEYAEDLAKIRRQAALRRRCSELGRLDGSDELLSAVDSVASIDASNSVAAKLAARRKSADQRRKSSERGSQRLSTADQATALQESSSSSGRRRRRRSSGRRQQTSARVKEMEAMLGRKLSPKEIKEIMDKVTRGAASPQMLVVTAMGVSEKTDPGIPADPADERSPKASLKASKLRADEIQEEPLSDDTGQQDARDDDGSLEADADDEGVDAEVAAAGRRRTKGRTGSAARRRRKTRGQARAQTSSGALDSADDSRTERGKRGDRSDRLERDSSVNDDQMHYRLSDILFLEEGVTQLPWDGSDPQQPGPRPPSEPESEAELVTHPVESGMNQFLQEFYPCGQLFVTWFGDGSGHVLYPSGEPAVLITMETAGRRFVVMPDEPCIDTASSNCVLAMFDPQGVGFIYSEKGTIRLLFDQREGWYHRDDGTERRWRWSDLDDHVHHSPTLQPVIFAINKHVAVRVLRQDYILLSFWACRRSAR
ncbi:uncharacterized protein LOC119096519 [Pollicipes pollicipes]|uniref:uncharacterized protein LOC119096519 n=1 Tax=Pollicipes pollicipes TaxID=41117 RepID=UPI001884983B|nr:uncharacterized protein LOC119096519 [Pollicipes pollicipes]